MSFRLDKNKIMRSSCVIMNCDQLSEINIGEHSFVYHESVELKNLPSLLSIQLDNDAFCFCHWIVFESMNDWMNDEWDLIRLQSITLGGGALNGDGETYESNELIMRSMNEVWLIMRSSFSDFIQRKWFELQWNKESDIG